MTRRPVSFLWLHFPFAVLIGILPLLVLVVAWLSGEREQIEDEIRGDQAAAVRTFAAIQGRVAEEHIRTLEAFAARIETEGLYRRPERLQFELEEARPLIGAVTIRVLDLTGRAVAFHPSVAPDGRPTIGESHADRPYFREALERKRTVVSTLLAGERFTGPNVMFATPLRERGRTVGVLAMDFALTILSEGLAAHGPSEYGRLFVLDHAGTALHVNAGMREPVLEDWRTSPQATIRRDAGGTRVITVEGRERLVSWQPVPSLGMVVGVEADRDALMQEPHRTIARGVFMAIAVAVALSLIMAIIGARLAGRQLARLREYLGRLAASDASADVPIPQFRVGELAAVAQDAQALARTIKQQSQEVEILYALDQALAKASEPEDVVRIAAERVVPLLGFDAAAVLLLEEQGQVLQLLHAVGLPTSVTDHFQRIPVGPSVAGRAVTERRPVLVSIDTYSARDVAAFEALRQAGFLTLVAVPLLAHGEVYGALSLVSRSRLESSASMLSLLTSVGTQIGLEVSAARERERSVTQERMAALGRLAAGIAHELRNPLSVIAGRIELLKRAATESETVARHVRSLAEAEARMRKIVDGLSTYSKPPKAEPAPLNLAELLAATRELVAYAARKNAVTVSIDTPPDLPVVRGDRSEVMQILLNLTSNAIEAMAETGGTLALGARADGARVIVEVADTGPGIAPETLPGIWEPFYTTKPEGTGLGLSIVRSLVDKQPGAEISVESVRGRGTTFRLALPLP